MAVWMMDRGSFLLSVLTLLMPYAMMDNCPSDWQQVQGLCFKLFEQEKEWSTASSDCGYYGGYLATVDSDIQQQYLYDVAKFQDKPIWLGYSAWNNGNKTVWKKLSMELPVSSGNQSSVPEYWSEGKRPKLLPDQANNSCVVVDPTYGAARASWAATSCSTERAYVCKKTEGACATGWRSHNATCYQFNINIKLSWYDASTYCKSQGGDMVAVDSNDVQLFLRSRLKELGLDENERLWLGGSDVDDTPKILKWPSGGAVDINATYWSSSKPRNSIQPLCLEMLSGGEWSTSDQCLKEQSFICQINDGKVVYPPTVKPAKGSCDPGWEANGFFCYYFDNSASVTWLEAQNICQDLGAEMVQIMNVREMSFINDHLTVSTWLGLSDRSAESEWESTNQKLAKYSNWIPTTPASGGGGAAQGYKCAIVLAGKNKAFWDEVPCNQNNAYMCQKLIGPMTKFVSTTKESGNSNKCGQSWQDDPLSEFCYQINTNSLSWSEAQLQCKHNGGEMASITSLQEQQHIAARIRAIPDTKYFWIGGNALWRDYGWVWNDGAPMAFLNWEAGRPHYTKNADCMEMDALSGVWRDENCHNRRGYICKKRGSTENTTPSTALSSTTEKPGYPHCDRSWSLYGQSCYRVCEDPEQWTSAKSTCRQESGDIVSILSANENDFVTSLAAEKGENPAGYWTGLNALRISNQFEWTDDISVSFTNWGAREPNVHLGDQLCVSLHASETEAGKWSSTDCFLSLPYVCKRPAAKVTSPPSVMYKGCNKGVTAAYKGSCYTVSSSRVTWSDADVMCRNSGGHLVEINNRLEQAYLAANVGERGLGIDYWIGLSKDENGTYIWNTGYKLEFTNWDRRHTGNEATKCVALTGALPSTGTWSSRACSLETRYICEFPRDGFSTPSTVSTTPRPASCPTGYKWSEYRNMCYLREQLYGNQRLTWFEAQDLCTNIGGELATIHSEEQMKAVMGPHTRFLAKYWIGLYKPNNNGGYVWIDQSALDFTNWEDGEPNDHNGLEGCVQLNRRTTKWSDVNCYAKRDYICQFQKGDPILTTARTVKPTPAPTCENHPKWLAYQNYCYFISPTYGPGSKYSWHDAAKYCMQNGGNLASIHDEDENRFVLLETTRLRHHENPWFWIGLNELDLESYKWSDGTTVDFLSWEENEPDDNYGGQKCVGFITETGHWHDENCGIENRFICKKHKDSKTTVTPSPTPVIQGNCPPEYHGIGNKCFILYGDATDTPQWLNWTEALDTCASLNSTIASITNPLEQALITTLLKGKSVDFWIGFHKRFITGQNVQKIEWVDNSKVDFDYWSRGEPNGGTYGVGMEDCVNVISRGFSAGRWQDRRCDIKMGFVCQTWKDARYPTPQPSQSPSPCPLGYESFGDACYQVTAAMTWEEANATCRRQQDHLVSITEPYEQAFVLLKRQRHTSGPIWLGLTRRGSLYYWVDGWPVSYVHWGSTEPSRGETDRCVALMPDGNWNDTDCGLKLQGICKRTSVIPPTTVVNPPGRCPDDKHWFDHGAYCYMFSNRTSYSYGWAHSSFLCQKHGGALASITNQDEMDFILRTIQQERYEKRNLWIGLVRKIKGAFAWFDHTPFNYENWAVGEPDNGNYKECTSVHPANGKWEVTNCYAARGFICKVAKVPPPTTPRPSCRPSWHTKDGMCYKGYYKSLTHKKTWSEAHSFCLSRGGDLASFHSAEDVRWFTGTIGFHSRYDLYRTPAWIGLFLANGTTGLASQYTWSDGTSFNYSHWEVGQPDNHNGRENCVAMYPHTGKWRDDNCAGARSWICMAPIAATTLPSVTTPSATENTECGVKWKSHGEYCYFLSDRPRPGEGAPMSWYRARQHCVHMGGDLLSINTREEADFITTHISQTNHLKMWLGANDLDLQGYRWSDGTPMLYTNWAKGQPSSQYGEQRCLSVNTGKENTQPGTLNDDPCTELLPFICKKPKTGGTPGTITTTPTIRGFCPRGFGGIGNRCFALFGDGERDRKNWTDAAAACAALGPAYSLASITNSLEQAYITSRLQYKETTFWIGLNDFDNEDFFHWVTNEEVAYENWDRFEPAAYQNENEDCVLVKSTRGRIGKWADERCSIPTGYICQTWKDSSIQTTRSTSTAETSRNTCPSAYTALDAKTCYRLYKTPKTWTVAQSQCERDEASLFVVTDAVMEADVVVLMDRWAEHTLWLGLKNNGEGDIAWVNGWPLTYTNWDVDNPNLKTGEKCGVIMDNGFWNVTDCGDSLPFICTATTAKPPSVTPPTPGWCPGGQGWVGHGAGCYYYDTHAQLNWAEANFACYERGGHLASFHNQEEIDFILGALERENRPRNLWIGLVRRENNTFAWYDDTVVDFTSWEPGQPNDFGGKEDCVEFKVSSGWWDDTECTVTMGFLCKTRIVSGTTEVGSFGTVTENCSDITTSPGNFQDLSLEHVGVAMNTPYVVAVAVFSVIAAGLVVVVGVLLSKKNRRFNMSASFFTQTSAVEFTPTMPET